MRDRGLLTLAQRIQLWVTAVELQEVIDHLRRPEHRGLGRIIGDQLKCRRRRRAWRLWWTWSAGRTERIRGRPLGVPSQWSSPRAPGRCVSKKVPSSGIISGRRGVDECAGQMAHRRRCGHVGCNGMSTAWASGPNRGSAAPRGRADPSRRRAKDDGR